MATFQVSSDTGTTATVVTAASTTFTLDGALRGPKGDDGITSPDATVMVKGKVKLAGDLGGTADLPTVPGLSSKALDSAVVHNTGDETIAGVKTFSSSPVAPTPASSTQVATKGYVDGVASSGGTPDADATTKGKVQLAGEFSGVGSTAAAPTIKNMLRVFNVKDYGAIGDGVTDDLTAIQNAINAATSVGGIVFFPAATYIVSNSIVPKSNVTLQGVQNISILKMSASAGRTIKLVNAALTNFTIDSMTFSGSVNSFPTVPTRTRTISGNGAETAVYITGDQDPFTGGTGAISNITLRNCKIQNHSALPIRISGTTGTVKVVDCDFINNQDPGFIFNDEVIFNNNHCMNGADNGVSLSRGNKKITCVGNTIENVAFQGIFIAGFDINGDGDVRNVGPTNFTVTGNTIKNCGYNGIYADAAPKHGVISGNVVQQGYYRGPVGTTTITAGSNGAVLPQATINVVSTIGFSSTGSFTLNSETITYTGITATTFTGCSGGTSTLATGNTVTMPATDINSVGIYVAGYSFPYNASTTIAAGSNGLTLPQSTISVASTSGFPSAGSLTLNGEIITYTGTTSTTFTGCSGGTLLMTTGDGLVMIPSAYAENIQITGNTLYQCARAGVELFAAKHINIDSNLILDCGTKFLSDGSTTIGSTSVASNVGILIHSAGTPVDISVRHNTITESRTGSATNTNGQYTNYGVVPYTNIPSTYTYANNRMSGCRNAYNLIDWSSDNHIYSGNGAVVQAKGLNDPHDNRVVTITDNASTAPNFLNVQGSIAGQAVALSAESFTETVIPFTIRSKGAATFAIRPGADLTTAIQLRRANSNPAVNIDTNRGDNLSRVGINTAAPASEMHVVGDVRSTNLILTNPVATTYGGTGQANLTSLPLTTPQITNGLNDSNGNRMITFTAVSSAVTNLTLQNAATGGNVAVGVSSTDTNAGLTVKSKGSGTIVFRPETDTVIATQFRKSDNVSANSVLDVDTSNARVGINTIAPTSDLDVNGKTTTASLKMTTSPTTGYVLTATDAAGNMSWQQPLPTQTGNARKVLVTDGSTTSWQYSKGNLSTFLVAASNAPASDLLLADYVCTGTADDIKIQAAVTAAYNAGGGTVLLSAGTFNIATSIAMAGPSTANSVNVTIKGQGSETTKLAGASNINVITLSGSIKVHISDIWFTMLGTGSGIVSTAPGSSPYWSFWLSSFKNLFFQGDFSSHSGWAMNLEAPFRSTFENIEAQGIGNGIYLKSTTPNFNPGNCTFTRCFMDLGAAANGVAYKIHTQDNDGLMNILTFIQCEAIDTVSGSTTSVGWWLKGSSTDYHATKDVVVINSNIEQFNTAVYLQHALDNDINLSYADVKNNGTIFKASSDSTKNKLVARSGYIAPSTTTVFCNDANSDATAPNMFSDFEAYVDTGATLSKTVTAVSVLRRLQATGPGTIDSTFSTFDMPANKFVGTLPVANGGTGQTSLTSLPLTTPKITTGVNDSNGNRILDFTATTSAVNRLGVQNAATGGNVAVSAIGSDTNIGVTFKSKGNGTIVFRPETDTIIASEWRKADNSTVVMDIDSTNGRVGIGTASPSRTLDVVGAGRMQQLLGSSGSSPSNAAGVGAGTSPTVTVTGTDVAGKIVVTAGTSPSASAAVITLTFGTTYPNAPYPMIIAGNTSAAALSGAASVYVTSNAADFTINVGSTALVNATQYIWYYHIVG